MEWRSRGYLKHIEAGANAQFVTFRLADSLPQAVVQEIESHRDEKAKLYQKYETALDAGYGSCLMKNPVGAQIVQNALRFHHHRLYELLSWVVMPNHVHVLLLPDTSTKLSQIMHSIKSFTASELNRMLGGTGRVWQPEYFDRIIRDPSHFEATVSYIEWNPVKAGLAVHPADYPYSSANPIAVGKL